MNKKTITVLINKSEHGWHTRHYENERVYQHYIDREEIDINVDLIIDHKKVTFFIGVVVDEVESFKTERYGFLWRKKREVPHIEEVRDWIEKSHYLTTMMDGTKYITEAPVI